MLASPKILRRKPIRSGLIKMGPVAHTYTHIDLITPTYTHACMHTHMHAHTHLTRTHVCTDMHVCSHIYTQNLHPFAYTYTRSHFCVPRGQEQTSSSEKLMVEGREKGRERKREQAREGALEYLPHLPYLPTPNPPPHPTLIALGSDLNNPGALSSISVVTEDWAIEDSEA